MRRISDITKTEIIELLQNGYTPNRDPFSAEELESWPIRINIYGRLSEIEFLKRIYDFSILPSYDKRFPDFEGDVWQHTINNYDYPDNWIFDDERLKIKTGEDKIFLAFLSEIFNPVVRKFDQNSKDLLELINAELKNDMYQIQPVSKLSGRDIYGGVDIANMNGVVSSQTNYIVEEFNTEYMTKMIEQMNSKIETDPTTAIGCAKEIVESCCITILNECKINYDKNKLSLTQLSKLTMKELKILPEYIGDDLKGKDSIQKILGSLLNITNGVAELRNDYGNGHGKDRKYKGLQPRHAKLAVGAATIFVSFVWETYKKHTK